MKTLQKHALEKFHEMICLEIKDLQEQRFKEELDLLETKDKLERLKRERERARFLEGKELFVMETAAIVLMGDSFRSFSPSAPSVAPRTNEEMSTPSREQFLPGQGKKLVKC